jgi:hypothetical protein
MKLWSWQTPDFDLTSGKVDHSKSTYYQDIPGYHLACPTLWEILGTNQIVWCYTKQNRHYYSGDDCNVEWILDVPQTNITLIDMCIWEKVIKSGYVPHELEQQWFEEALKKAPHDSDRRQEIVGQKKDEYLAPVSEEELWNQLFLPIDDVSDRKTTAIIPHPIQKDWVVDQEIHTIPMSPIGLDY